MRIGVTLGDIAGIGPEVALKSLEQITTGSKFFLLGPESFYRALAKKLKLKKVTALFGRSVFFDDTVTLPSRWRYGASQNELSVLAVRSIEQAVKLALCGKIDAIVTPPINKAGVKAAGFDIPGHTEYLARLSDTRKFEMMLVGGPLRVTLVTRHTPIKHVSTELTQKRVIETILMTDQELRKSFGIKNPKLVVCGLNPHAGEKGHIGNEEIKIIEPAVKRARQLTRSKIIGPLAPDTVFYGAYAGEYDAEICMYHDQGLIPLKMISRGGGVNVTLGLPFVRTSPDHGTAYDIAGRGVADAGSMTEALALAMTLARNRNKK